MTLKAITSLTKGQKKQVRRFAEDALDRAITEGILDHGSAQKLIENGDEFQADILASVRRLSLSNQYADEECKSNYGYPKTHKVKDVAEQLAILQELLPNIGKANLGLAKRPLPSGAEAYWLLPRWEKVAPTYNEAVEKVLTLIKFKRTFYNYREGELGESYLRQSAKKAKAMQKLGQEQEGYDVLVVPCQFGLRHRGRSVRRAREVMNLAEFGLGAYEIGIMLLTHPDREVCWEQLHLDCAGDEYSPDAGGRFGKAPIFCFSDGEVKFDADWVGYFCGQFSSASGFLPQE